MPCEWLPTRAGKHDLELTTKVGLLGKYRAVARRGADYYNPHSRAKITVRAKSGVVFLWNETGGHTLKEQPRILIVGVGSIGERHVRCFQATGRAALAICDLNASLREQVAEQYAIDQTYADLETALQEPFDAAVIATPAPLHIPMALQMAARNVHLLIEKPLSTSLENVERLNDEVEQRKLVACVAYVHRANPALAAMRAAINAGRFGAPRQLVVSVGQHFPTYRPAYREIYYADRKQGGGAVQDALTHVLDAGQWLVGRIDRLASDVEHQVLEGVEVEDTAHVLARHGSVLGAYSLNQYQLPNELSITVVCGRGTARFELHRQRWRWMETPDSPWHDEPFPLESRDDVFVRQAEAFLDTLVGEASPLCSLDEAAHTLRANLAVLRSAETRVWEQLGE